MSKLQAPFTPLNIAILTVSDSRTLAEDTSGQYLVDQLTAAGHAIITTGGTGFYIRDSMPEAVGVLFDKSVDGFGEMFRLISKDDIGMSTIQSRAVAGMANGTGIFCLPGSSGACRTAWEGILQEQLDSRTRPCNFVPHFMRTNPGHD